MTNSLKINYSQYQALIPALQQYRKELIKKAGLDSEDYYRIYTEKRTSGARSKIYSLFIHRFGGSTIMSDLIDAMNAHIQDTPTITVDGIEYKVIVKQLNRASIGIYFKAIAPSTPRETTQSTESTNQNTNNTNMNNAQTTESMPSIFNEAACTANKTLYVSGKLPLANFAAIPGLYVEYCGNAELDKNGTVTADIIEWYFDINKEVNPDSPFHGLKYEDFKMIVEGIASSQWPSIATFNQHITDRVYGRILLEGCNVFKPVVIADPKPAVDAESIIKAFIMHVKSNTRNGEFEDVASDIASDAASNIESDIENMVTLSLDYNNQITIEVDTRECHNCIEDVAEIYINQFVDRLDGIADDFLAENAQSKGHPLV